MTGNDGPRLEVVCFDLDDTLVNASDAWLAGLTEALTEAVERYPSLAAIDDLAGLQQRLVYEAFITAGGEWDPQHVRNSMRRLLRDHAERNDALADRAFALYTDAWPRHLTLFPDTLEALAAARQHARLALITNGTSSEQRLKLERLGLLEHFDVVSISQEVGALKPHGAIFAHALDALEVRPAAALHIGDDQHADVQGAREAGLTAVWLNRHARTRRADIDPHHEVTDLHGLVRLLRECSARLRTLTPSISPRAAGRGERCVGDDGNERTGSIAPRPRVGEGT